MYHHEQNISFPSPPLDPVEKEKGNRRGLPYRLMLLFPCTDFFLTPFQRPARRTLATPIQLPQDAPGLRRVILHSAFSLNQISHAPGCPQLGLKAQRMGPAFQTLLDTLRVLSTQPRLAPARPALRSDRLPPCCNCFAHRLTDCYERRSKCMVRRSSASEK